MHQLLYLKHVLIETYWNVKNCQGTPFGVGAQVLIETYWNVKYVELMAGFHALLY